MIPLAYAFYFVIATAAPIQRRWLSTKKEGGSKIDFSFKTSVVGAALSLLVIFFSPFYLRGSPSTLFLLVLLIVIGGVGYNISYYTAQRHVEAGVTYILGNIYTPLTIVLSTIFLGEGLRGVQIIGTILLLAATLIVSKKHRIGRFKYDRYFWLMLLSGIFLSILLIALRELMKITGLSASLIFETVGIAIGLGILTFFVKGKTTYTAKEITVTGTLKFFQDLSFSVLMYVVANLSLVSAVTTFKVVFVFLVAAIVLKEREDVSRKVLGCIIALVGLLLMR